MLSNRISKSVKIPPGAALWSIYISGRMGPEKHLGYVIADSKSMAWAKSFSVLAMDIVSRQGLYWLWV